MLDLYYPNPVLPGAPKPETTKNAHEAGGGDVRPSYRAFVFLPDRLAESFCAGLEWWADWGPSPGNTPCLCRNAAPGGVFFPVAAAMMILFAMLRRGGGRRLLR